MNIKESVLKKIKINPLDKILEIDNKVGKTNLTSKDIINFVSSSKALKPINVRFSILSNGNLENTIDLLLNYYENINYIYLNHRNLGNIIYLVSIINEIYGTKIEVAENNIDDYMLLDNIILTGDNDFINCYKEIYKNKNLVIYN